MQQPLNTHKVGTIEQVDARLDDAAVCSCPFRYPSLIAWPSRPSDVVLGGLVLITGLR